MHSATVSWQRGDAEFLGGRYARAHAWNFDGGLSVPASSSPSVVRPPWSDPAAVDPEEAFVAALASCHMLWFLDFASRAGLIVDDYEDAASGVMGPDAAGRTVMLRVTLRPRARFSPATPAAPAIPVIRREHRDRSTFRRERHRRHQQHRRPSGGLDQSRSRTSEVSLTSMSSLRSSSRSTGKWKIRPSGMTPKRRRI